MIHEETKYFTTIVTRIKIVKLFFIFHQSIEALEDIPEIFLIDVDADFEPNLCKRIDLVSIRIEIDLPEQFSRVNRIRYLRLTVENSSLKVDEFHLVTYGNEIGNQVKVPNHELKWILLLN